jgi:K+-transporting ATPase ATPase A chain
MGFAWTIIVLVVALGITWRYLGSYMAAVFDGRVHFLAWAERPVYRALGTGPEQEQNWKRYAASMVIFSGVAMAITYLLIRIQGSLPLNPQHFGAVGQALSFNTAASFMTNTNWQNYGGETTMSYFSQVGALTFEQFVSPAIGIAVAIGMVRGFSRRNSPTIGNFWVDITRSLLYIFFPIAFVFGIIIVGQGAVQTLAGTITIHDAINGVTQTIARGPIGSMQSIMQLGNNGGGFLNANQATAFERPASPAGWTSTCSCPFPSPSPTPSGRWWGASATASPFWPPWSSSSVCGSATPAMPSTARIPRWPLPGCTRRSATPRARRFASATPPAPCSAWLRPTPPPARPTPPTTSSPPSVVWG